MIGLKMRACRIYFCFRYCKFSQLLYCSWIEWLSSFSDMRRAFFEYQSKSSTYIRFIIELGLELNMAALEKLIGKWWNMARKIILDGSLLPPRLSRTEMLSALPNFINYPCHHLARIEFPLLKHSFFYQQEWACKKANKWRDWNIMLRKEVE